MIIGVNELKTLIRHIPCEYKCKFDSRKFNSNQKWNNYKCRCLSKNSKKKKFLFAKKIMFGILLYAVIKVLNI